MLDKKLEIDVKNTLLLWKTCIKAKNFISLHRVFHSIRFKVNKDWVTAVTLFSFIDGPLHLPEVRAFRHNKQTQSR